MGAGSPINASDVRAQVMAEKADDGELTSIGSYSLLETTGRYRVGVDPSIVRNLPISKGEHVEVYVDYDRGVAVYDFGGGLAGEEE